MTRPNEAGGGGLTGATGDLTPDDAEEPFVPAEQRAISDPGLATSEPRAGPDQNDESGRRAGGTTPGEDDGDEFSDHEEHF